MERRNLLVCPHCGNCEDLKTLEDRYYCPSCNGEYTFAEDDEKREEIRHKMSAILMDTDEEHPMKCDALIGEAYACGLSTLQMPRVDRCFQQPGEGIIWIHIEGAIDYQEFDDFETCDLKDILVNLEYFSKNLT